MELNEIVKVIDKTDKKVYTCKIVEVDDENQKIKVHFIDWSDRFDEWLHIKSSRIVGRADENHTTVKNNNETPDPVVRETEVIVGSLLMNSNEVQKSVLSGFNHKDSLEKNAKNLNKFQVQMLEDTAEYLHIKIIDNNSKKLFNKNMLIKKIINKVLSLLPSVCPDCQSSYSVDLSDKPLFSCARCDRGAHNCDSIRTFHSSLPASTPKGFLWLCSACRDDIAPEDATLVSTCLEEPRNTIDVTNSQTRETAAVITPHTSGNEVLPSIHEEIERSDEIIGAPKSVRAQICIMYKKGICRHGLRGNNLIDGKKCSFDHPRACRKYTAYGSKDKRGCKPGSNCKLYHPILCRFSVKSRLCTNEKCTFVHLKGTQRRKEEEGQVYPQAYPVKKPVISMSSKTPNRVVPKNDPLERLETMIIEMKKAQEAEINTIKRELCFFKNQNQQSRWGTIPQWYHTQPQTYQNSMPYYQNFPVQLQGGIHQTEGNQLGMSKPGQQVRAGMSETIGVLPSSY